MAHDSGALFRHADNAAWAGKFSVFVRGYHWFALRVQRHGSVAKRNCLPVGSKRHHTRSDLRCNKGIATMLKSILLNRFSLTLGTIFAAALIWNIYVEANNDGILIGQVVDQKGAPVANAAVSVSGKTIASTDSVGVTTTDENGRFRFTNLNEYSLILTAKLNERVSDNRNIRLWFRRQNTSVSPALVLHEGSGN